MWFVNGVLPLILGIGSSVFLRFVWIPERPISWVILGGVVTTLAAYMIFNDPPDPGK